MKLYLLSTAFTLFSCAAMAQTTPGDQFLENWDLNGDGTATLAELQQMRSDVFYTFDSNEDGFLDAEEYVYFDAARANDVSNYEDAQRAQMRKVAEGMSLNRNDLDGDGKVARIEFLKGAETWFESLDKNGDGGITLQDFHRR